MMTQRFLLMILQEEASHKSDKTYDSDKEASNELTCKKIIFVRDVNQVQKSLTEQISQDIPHIISAHNVQLSKRKYFLNKQIFVDVEQSRIILQ